MKSYTTPSISLKKNESLVDEIRNLNKEKAEFDSFMKSYTTPSISLKKNESLVDEIRNLNKEKAEHSADRIHFLDMEIHRMKQEEKEMVR
jgi:hypothetical protein